jgi:hypothetical protein
MIQVIIAQSGILKETIAEFEKQIEVFDLKIVDRWVSSKTNNMNIAVNAHTIEKMSQTDTLARRIFAKDFIECNWLY